MIKGQRATKGVGLDSGAPQSSARASAGVFINTELEQAQRRQEKAAAAVREYTAEIDRSSTALAELKPRLTVAARVEREFGDATQKQNTQLKVSRDALTKARDEYSQLAAVAERASTAVAGFAASQGDVGKALARTAAETARVKAQLETLNSSTVAPVATDRRGLLESRRTYVEAQAEVRRLAAEMKAAEVPTEALGDALGKAQAKAQLAAKAYEQNSIALRKTSATQSSITKFLAATATEQQKSANAQVRALAAQTRAANQGAEAQQRLRGATLAALPPIKAMAPAVKSAAGASDQATQSANRLRSAFNGFYSDSRQSLSLFQRLRGQVLSIAAAYIGLQSALQNVGGVVNAFQEIEGAQSRLGVVFERDTARISQELDFLQQNADRLGISFGILSDQYTKFAVAAKTANFTSDATRKIFLSVAEAGRVNKLSIDQLEGTFLALEQMISKGKVSSEELRRQMGDRLPGAFSLFAKAIGVSTAQLDDMLRKGEVFANQSTLLKFADQLNKEFGPQLAASIEQTTAEIGRFDNNVFEAQKRVADGGFLESFTNGLRKLNEQFRSREGRDFFLGLGAVLGHLTDGIVTLLPYADDLAKVLAVIATIKAAQGLSNLVTALRATAAQTVATNRSLFTWASTVEAARVRWNTLVGTLRSGTGALAAINAQLRVATVVAGTAGGRFLALRIAIASLQSVAALAAGTFRILWTAIGGLPGLILTGVTLAIGSWLTKIDDTTSAIDEHKRIMDEVVKAYDKVRGKTEEWAKAIENVTLDQAVANLRQMEKRFEDIKKTVSGISGGDFFSFNSIRRGSSEQRQLVTQLRDIRTAFINGKLTARDYVAQIESLYDAIDSDGVRQWAEQLLESGRNAKEAEQQLGAAALTAKELGDTSDRVTEILQRTGTTIQTLTTATDDASTAFRKMAAEDARRLVEALHEMDKLVPSIADELKRIEELDGLNKQYQDAVKLARSLDQVRIITERYNRASAAILENSIDSSSGIVDAIIGAESGGNPYAKNKNSTATGVGQFIEETWLKLFKENFPDRAQSMTDAAILELRKSEKISREMIALYVQENAKILKDAGAAVTDANLYLAHFLGPNGAVKVLSANRGTQASDVLSADAVAANSSVLSGKTVEEVIAWAQQKVGLSREEAAINKEIADIDAKRAEKAKDYNKELENRLQLQEDENANAGNLSKEGFIQKRLSQEQRRAKEAEYELTAEQVAQIKAAAAAEYELVKAKRDGRDATKEANAALAQAQALETKRNALIAQFKQAYDTGNTDNTEQLKNQILEINSQLLAAIENARAMWEEIGGSGAAAKLMTLDALAEKAKTAGQRIEVIEQKTNALGLTATQSERLVGSFADGLVGAFENFAQAVANGANAFQALGSAFLQFAADFLREIAVMILKQAILNALAGFGGPIGTAAKALGGTVPTGHTGGKVGTNTIGIGNSSRVLPISMFRDAVRYHTGGKVGLGPGEVPAVLQTGEEVLTKNDPRHSDNIGPSQAQGGGGIQAIRNIVTLDPEFAKSMVESAQGEKAVMSVLTKNKALLKRLVS
ncbi:tape measure protein [Hartmannibacter diazotrophicus]|uniref:tape measure protein n=1 Tax=Hartmannibacter diazotrophicus TaxID=1482074 RepID=UPI0012FD3BE8|nr:tape measure protein [Hartmannibacter diazotrophicus]